MKTSVLEVPDMLSVLTVDEVEKRFEEVPGVKSATVNYAAGTITVRYDETLLKVADISIFVHQRGQESAGKTQPEDEGGNKPGHQPHVEPAPGAAPASASASASAPEPEAPKAEPAPAEIPAATAPAAEGHADKPVPDAPTSPAAG